MKKCLLKLLVLLLASAPAVAQTVSGRVTNSADGAGLPGVSVLVKGTSTGTSTDSDGQYSINVPDQNSTLVFSFIGFASQEVAVGGRTTLDVSLAEDITQLSEVVVTALGIPKETKALGYAVSKVGGESLTKARELNVANSLVGRVAGLNASAVAGGPGSSSNVRIRGGSSMFANNAPLYVINGVPIESGNRGEAGMWGGADLGDGIGNINPDDIEEMTVLKGSTASALYGSRAANGVIVITTKKGKAGAPTVEFNSNYTIDKIMDLTDFQYEYGQGLLGNKPTDAGAALNAGPSSWGDRLDGSSVIQFDGVSRPYSAQKNNLKNFYRTGSTFTNTLSISGGNDYTTARLSLSDLKNVSVVPNAGMKRNTFNLNLDQKIGSKIKVSLMSNVVLEKSDNRPTLSDSPGNANFGILFMPTSLSEEVLRPGSLPNGDEMQYTGNIYQTNPWFAANKFINDISRKRFINAVTARYDITKDIYVQGRVQQDLFFDRQSVVVPTGTAYPPQFDLTQNSNQGYEFNADFLAGVKKDFNDDLSADLTVGANLRKNRVEFITATGQQFSVPFLYTIKNSTFKGSNYEMPRQEVQSVYYSIGASYKNILFLNTTGRKDWFSTLPMESNSLFYPSVGASVVFSELFDSQILSFGKVRTSWAQTSGGANPYQTQLTYTIDQNVNGFPIGLINGANIPNNQLKPYIVQEIEFGVDMKFLENRIGLDVAYFNRKTTDEIVNRPVSMTSGYTGAVVNLGEWQNNGFELLITGEPVKTDNFSWNISFNFTKMKSEVLKLSDNKNDSIAQLAESRTRTAFISHVVGKPISQVMAFDYARNADGEIIYDALGAPQRGRLLPYGSGIHDTFGGINNEFRFGGLSVSFLIDYKFGAKIFSATNSFGTGFGLTKETLAGREEGILGEGVKNTDNTTPNDVTADPWDYYGGLAGNVSSHFVYDADFVKLRQVVIGYTLPSKWFGKTPIKAASVSLVGRNLAILKKDTPNIDPESNFNASNAQGLELAGVPPARSYGFNVNLRF